MKTVVSSQNLIYPENFITHAFWIPRKILKNTNKYIYWIMNEYYDFIDIDSALVYRISAIGPKSMY